MQMIHIEGLTQEQVAMLDIIWAMDTPAEIEEFVAGLDPDEQLEYQVLSKMLIFAVIDQETNKMSRFELAEQVLSRVM